MFTVSHYGNGFGSYGDVWRMMICGSSSRRRCPNCCTLYRNNSGLHSIRKLANQDLLQDRSVLKELFAVSFGRGRRRGGKISWMGISSQVSEKVIIKMYDIPIYCTWQKAFKSQSLCLRLLQIVSATGSYDDIKT